MSEQDRKTVIICVAVLVLACVLVFGIMVYQGLQATSDSLDRKLGVAEDAVEEMMDAEWERSLERSIKATNTARNAEWEATK